MKISVKIKFISVFILFTLISCENEEIISPDSLFIEYTVVQAEIQPGKIFPGVRFTKTLPLGIPYDIKQAELKNITAYLVKNEVQVIPLLYFSDGLYKPKYEFYVEEGEVYELYAEQEDKLIYGKTIIPYKPEITAVRFISSENYLEADLISKFNEVYGALWILTGTSAGQSDDFFSITSESNMINQPVNVRTGTLPDEAANPNYNGQKIIQVYSFDASFRDYFYSRTSGGEITDPFIQGGGVIEWNVQGDKVIGMFVGVTPGDAINVN